MSEPGGRATGGAAAATVLDTQGIYAATAGLPEQVFDAAERARGLDDLPSLDRIEHVVVLEQVSTAGRPLSELLAPLDRYAASGEINSRVDNPRAVIERLAQRYAEAGQDRLDGLTVDFGPWWFNARPSNTEPLLRLNLEAPTRAECDARTAEVLAVIRGEEEG